MGKPPSELDVLRLRGGSLELEVEDILEIIPHRLSLLMLDRVFSLVPGEHGVGLKAVTGNECGLAPRKHGFIFPSTMALEALIQLAMVVLSYPNEWNPEKVPDVFLPEIENFAVHREMVEPGRVYLTVTISRPSESLARVEGAALLGGEPYVDAVFQLAL